MMKKLLLCIIIYAGITGKTVAKHNIDSLMNVLDNEVENYNQYVQKYNESITTFKENIRYTRTDQERYDLNKHLFYSYQAFQNDSALHYLNECRKYAQRMGRKDLEGEILARQAFQLSTVGMYYESRELLHLIDASVLTKEGRLEYYNARIHLYHELSYYTNVDWIKKKYKALECRLIDSLQFVADKTDDVYYKWKGFYYYEKEESERALKLFKEWVDRAQPGSREFATAAFFMYLINARLQNQEEVKYWLIVSAITDIRNSIMDQASLWTLANILAQEGDVKRAHSYITYSWDAATQFQTKVRSGQISPILSMIETSYQTKIREQNMWLTVAVVVVSLMLILFIGLLWYVNRQRKHLHSTRNELRTINDELQNVNTELKLSNVKLNESNRVKEEYIGRFLSLCSLYIDKIEEQRKRVNKMVKAKQYDDLYNATRTTEMKKKELEELYSNFDAAFTHLFPNFVDELNALIAPEERIMTKDGRLTTTIRIFALIRLGIDDSNKIAEFLNYSVHTIYNYRVKIRNAALCDRNEFEQKIKELGLSSEEA